MADTKQANEYLEAQGAPGGAALQRLDYTMKDTYFLNVSTALIDTPLFGPNTGVTHRMYKHGSFPFVNQSFKMTHIRIVPLIDFTVATNILQINNYYAHMLENSWLEIKVEGKEFLQYPMFRGVDIAAHQLLANVPAATNSHVAFREKFNSWDKLDTDITLPKGTQVEVEFKPAAGLTTAAAVANQDYVWPNAGLTSNLGFAIFFYIKGKLERINY